VEVFLNLKNKVWPQLSPKQSNESNQSINPKSKNPSRAEMRAKIIIIAAEMKK
jgi:hypothetical protein